MITCAELLTIIAGYFYFRIICIFKVWSEVGVPDMSPIYGHLMSMYDNRDTKLLLYGGGDTKSSKFQEKGHSFEIDLVPSWSQKHRDGKKRLGNQEKKRSKHIK